MTISPFAHVVATAANTNSLHIGPFTKNATATAELRFDVADKPTPIAGTNADEAIRAAQQLVDGGDPRFGERFAAVLSSDDGTFAVSVHDSAFGIGSGNRTWWGNDRFEANVAVTDAASGVVALVGSKLNPVHVVSGQGTAQTVID